jgi:hypothetical protein
MTEKDFIEDFVIILNILKIKLIGVFPDDEYEFVDFFAVKDVNNKLIELLISLDKSGEGYMQIANNDIQIDYRLFKQN